MRAKREDIPGKGISASHMRLSHPPWDLPHGTCRQTKWAAGPMANTLFGKPKDSKSAMGLALRPALFITRYVDC